MVVNTALVAKAWSFVSKRFSGGTLGWFVVFASLALWGNWRYCRSMTTTDFCDAVSQSPWIAGILFFALILLLGKATDAAQAKLMLWYQRKSARAYLRHLMNDEKRVLAVYMKNGSKSQYFHAANGTVRALEKAGILEFLGEASRANQQVSFTIQPWVVEELNRHPELFQ